MNNFNFLPNSQYMIVANTGKCEKRLIDLKFKLKDHIGSFPSLYSIPHITLVSFSMPNFLEDVLIQRLTLRLKSVAFFKVTCNGIHAWANSKTIFVQTSQNETLNLGSSIYQELNKKIVNNIYHSLKGTSGTAHITIARGLDHRHFEIAKELLMPITFRGEFWVKEIILLKRNGYNKNLEEVCKIPLGTNLEVNPIISPQLSLF